MIIDLNKIKKNIIDTDVLIVGSGTMGLYLADRLKKKFKKITIIEKGGKLTKIKKNKSNKNNFPIHNGFKKTTNIGLGGNSTLWGGQLVEFDKEDFNKKIYWGLNYSEIKKYYQLVYKYLNINLINQKDFLKKTKQKKIKVNNLSYFYTHWLNEPNFKKFFFKSINNDDYDIFLNSEIIKLNFHKNTCNYVLVKSKKKIKKVKSKIIIFCCGTFNNNKIILTQKKNSPWSNNKNVGKFFQDHLGLIIGKIKILNKRKFYNIFLNGIISNSNYQPKIKSRYKINGFNYGISGEIKTKSEFLLKETNNAIKLFYFRKNIKNFINLFKIFKKTDLLWITIKRIIYYLFNKKLLFPNNNELYFYIQCEQKPNIKSNIFLKSNHNNAIDLNWNISGNELLVTKKFVNDVKNYYEKNNIFKLDSKIFFNLKNKDFKKKLRDTNHSSGGLIISKNKKKGVVDKNLKIWNTSNLFIAGPSVLPKISHANTTLTSLALTERLSNYLNKKFY